MAAHEHINAEQLSLFDATPYTKPAPKMDYDPETWAARPDISYHASASPQMPREGEPGGGFGVGFHHGTVASAMHRGRIDSSSHISSDNLWAHNSRDFVHPVRVEGPMALFQGDPSAPSSSPIRRGLGLEEQEGLRRHPTAFSDNQANIKIGTNLVEQGETVPYVNAVEVPGSVSFRSPRSHLNTWAEDVASDPGASRHHQLLAEQFDLTIPARENFSRDVLRRGGAKNLPHSLSGEVVEQGTLFGPSEARGSSKVSVMRPRLKRKNDG